VIQNSPTSIYIYSASQEISWFVEREGSVSLQTELSRSVSFVLGVPNTFSQCDIKQT